MICGHVICILEILSLLYYYIIIIVIVVINYYYVIIINTIIRIFQTQIVKEQKIIKYFCNIIMQLFMLNNNLERIDSFEEQNLNKK